MSGSAARALRELYRGWSEARLSPRARETARMGILDAVACIVCGARTQPARLVRDFARTQGAAARASVLGTGLALAPPLAALANGVAGHALDYDDMNSTLVGHPSVVLVPALFALAEARGCSGSEVVSAYVLGFEVDAFFARILVPRHYDAGWHSTSSIGIFGAAAGACRLMGLDDAAALNALAIAASSAAGLRANFGSMTKSLHAGQAAESALRSAELSSRGFTANADVFDGALGFFALYAANDTARPAPPGLEIEASGIGLKPYPCCGAGVSLIDAALEARGTGLLAGDIASVDCAVTPMAAAIMPYAAASDGLQARYSLPYCAAVALLDGRAGLAQFQDERVRRPDVQGLMDRVQVRTDAALATGEGRFGVRVIVRLRDGATRAAVAELPLGHPRRPLDRARRVDKFLECAAPVVGEARAREAATHLEALETLPRLDPAIRPLCKEET